MQHHTARWSNLSLVNQSIVSLIASYTQLPPVRLVLPSDPYPREAPKPAVTLNEASGSAGAWMMFPTNGRRAFECVSCTDSGQLPPLSVGQCTVLTDGRSQRKQLVVSMLERECGYRTAYDMQYEYDTGVNTGAAMNAIVDRLQRKVVREFGFGRPVSTTCACAGRTGNCDAEDKCCAAESDEAEVVRGLNILRSAQAEYPGDPEIRDAAFYIKYNRAEQGSLSVGDDYREAALHRMDGSAIKLSEYYQSVCGGGGGAADAKEKSGPDAKSVPAECGVGMTLEPQPLVIFAGSIT